MRISRFQADGDTTAARREAAGANRTVTKKDLVDRIAEESGAKRIIVKRIIQTFLDEIVSELGSGNRLEFRDFGVFEVRERAPRVAQNPKTMEKVPVQAKRTVKFKVGRLLKERLVAESANGAPTPVAMNAAASVDSR
ncbi:MAG: integration host factor subunit beta [Phycisphaerales bacterium]|nr:integration host factor subunit beta [Phycisphaerales bacterium]